MENRDPHPALVPPTTDRVERAFLGSLLVLSDAGVVSRCARIVTEECLARESHRAIYAAILAIARDGANPDLVLALAELDDRKQLERAGGAAYLASVVDDLPDVENVVRYAEIIRERAAVRRTQQRAARGEANRRRDEGGR